MKRYKINLWPFLLMLFGFAVGLHVTREISSLVAMVLR